MRVDEADKAIDELARRDAVAKLISLNKIRVRPELADDSNYRSQFNGYYRLRQRSKQFYATFYQLLKNAAESPGQADLPYILNRIFEATEERHLSFSSKLLATVRDDAVVFDKYVAQHFGVSTSPLPPENWVEAAERRYEKVRSGVEDFLKSADWPEISARFNNAFPEALSLPDIRKADLVVWAFVGASR